MNSSLGFLIKKRIEEKHLTAGKVEKLAGLKVNAVRNIISGASKKPSAVTLKAIANVLGCSIEELLGTTGHPKISTIKDIGLEGTWEVNLSRDIIDIMVKELSSKNTSLTAEVAYFIMKEIYSYSVINNNNIIDTKFAHWIIGKNIS